MNKTLFLLQNGYAPEVKQVHYTDTGPRQALITVCTNMLSYGYIPSLSLYEALSTLNDHDLAGWWFELKPAIFEQKAISKEMAKFAVYKNFPEEVLNKSETDYWLAQLFIYMGAPAEMFAEEKVARPEITENLRYQVLSMADDVAWHKSLDELVAKPSGWTEQEKTAATTFLPEYLKEIKLADFAFNLNGIFLAADSIDRFPIIPDTATNVLRLVVAMSYRDNDISLRIPSRIKSLSRPERKRILSWLNSCENLANDVSMRPEQWKKLFHALRPGDYKFDAISRVYNDLYTGKLKSISAQIENAIKEENPDVFDLLLLRPGEFMRRLHKLYAVYGDTAIDEFLPVIRKIATSKLLKIKKYIATHRNVSEFVTAPRGQWEKLKKRKNEKEPLSDTVIFRLLDAINQELGNRLRSKFPEGFNISDDLVNIKFPATDQSLFPYGRGTSFNIPDDATFVRTGSYWHVKDTPGNVWFDNGFNFFDESWKPKKAICWDSPNPFKNKSCVFSGDPVTSQTTGRASQFIDLYPEKLKKMGVRYAVWGILSYSGIKFDDAENITATLQFGKDAKAGEIYEPARADIVMPLQGNGLVKYILYLDIVERKIVIMDSLLPSCTQSAKGNIKILSDNLPAYIDYLSMQPELNDLLEAADGGTIPALYSDESNPVQGQAYIFKKTNPDSDITDISLTELLE